jgi:nucleotide-binding universal stress UspA family protein
MEHWLRSGDAVEEIVRAVEESGAKLVVAGTHGRGGLGRALMGSVAEKLLRAAPCPVITLKSTAKMPRFDHVRTILCPTDFSADSKAAFAFACSLARDLGATVRVLHVAPPPIVTPLAGVLPPDPERVREELTRQLADMKAPDVHTQYQLIFKDDAAESIVRTADAGKADLVVMGTHGRTGVRRALLGSVAEDVVRHAGCPVMTVKAMPESASATVGKAS